MTSGKMFCKTEQGRNEANFHILNKYDLLLFLFCLYVFLTDFMWKLVKGKE